MQNLIEFLKRTPFAPQLRAVWRGMHKIAALFKIATRRVQGGQTALTWDSKSYQNLQNHALNKNSFLDKGKAWAPKTKILFVSHDATLTGAPAIILKLLEMFSSDLNNECFTILGGGGPRIHHFKRQSHTYQMSHGTYDASYSDVERAHELRQLFAAKEGSEKFVPTVAIVNSAESFKILDILKQMGIPTISLIHEYSSYYPTAVVEGIIKASDTLIVPSQAVAQGWLQTSNVETDHITVEGQGLLSDSFGQLDVAKCRQRMRATLDLPQDAKIILNVGSIDHRKGIDQFVSSALCFFATYPEDQNVFFVWVGFGDPKYGSPFQSAKADLERMGFSDRFRFVQPTSLIEPMFVGADVFFLSARADPNPCVIHEAMAASLPVICFRSGGGAAEVVSDTTGTIVNFGDGAAVADAVHKYSSDEKLRTAHGAAAYKKVGCEHKFEGYYDFVRELAGKQSDKASTSAPTLPNKKPTTLVICDGNDSSLDALIAFVHANPNDTIAAHFLGNAAYTSIKTKLSSTLKVPIDWHLRTMSNLSKEQRANNLSSLLLEQKASKLVFIGMAELAEISVFDLLKSNKILVDFEGSSKGTLTGKHFDAVLTMSDLESQ